MTLEVDAALTSCGAFNFLSAYTVWDNGTRGSELWKLPFFEWTEICTCIVRSLLEQQRIPETCEVKLKLA